MLPGNLSLLDPGLDIRVGDAVEQFVTLDMVLSLVAGLGDMPRKTVSGLDADHYRAGARKNVKGILWTGTARP